MFEIMEDEEFKVIETDYPIEDYDLLQFNSKIYMITCARMDTGFDMKYLIRVGKFLPYSH